MHRAPTGVCTPDTACGRRRGAFRRTLPAATALAASLLVGLPAVANAAVDLRVDFGTAASDSVAGYVKDSGAAYGLQPSGATFGWVTYGTTTPASMTSQARDRTRASTPPLDDSLIQMNPTGGPTGSWALAVPNGRYDVTVSVGDQPTYDSNHT